MAGTEPAAILTEPENLPAVPGEVSYEVELDAPPAAAHPAIYVDVTTAETRLPVIPPQWHGMANIRATLVRHSERKKHQLAYHGLRLPVYLLRALAYAAAGALRLGWRHIHWAFLAEAHPLRSQVIAAGDHEAYLKLHHAGADARRARLPWTAAAAAVLGGRDLGARGAGAVVGVGAAAGARCRCWPGTGARRTSAIIAAGGGDAAVPEAERRHRAARLLRGRARRPGEARPAGHVRLDDGPRRRRHRGSWSTCRTARA